MELTEKNIRAAQPGQVLRDATIKGLHLRVFPESRSFYLYYRTKTGTERKPKLGELGADARFPIGGGMPARLSHGWRR